MSFNNLILSNSSILFEKWGKSSKKMNIAIFYVLFLHQNSKIQWN